MYNELTLYYLNQMDINPWVLKGGGQSTGFLGNELVIITDSPQDTQTQTLLTNIIDFTKFLQFEPIVRSSEQAARLTNAKQSLIIDLEDLIKNPRHKKGILHDLLSQKKPESFQ